MSKIELSERAALKKRFDEAYDRMQNCFPRKEDGDIDYDGEYTEEDRRKWLAAQNEAFNLHEKLSALEEKKEWLVVVDFDTEETAVMAAESFKQAAAKAFNYACDPTLAAGKTLLRVEIKRRGAKPNYPGIDTPKEG